MNTEPRPVLMPDAHSFADVLDYLSEWNHATMSHSAGRAPAGRLEPRLIADNEIGPYCAVDLSAVGGPRHRGIAVRATDATMAALDGQLVTPDDRLSFHVIAWTDGRALVLLQHGYILGDHWLAFVDPATIPAAPAAE